MSLPSTAELFLSFSRQKLLKEFWPRLRACVALLTDEQIWWRPNESSNCIGNLMLHLEGNVRQWLVASFRHEADARDRPTEFSRSGGLSPKELLDALDATLSEAAIVLDALTDDQLRASYEIQGYRVTGLDAVYQVVEHFGLHYGQIAYITKMLTDRNLGFYKELDRTSQGS